MEYDYRTTNSVFPVIQRFDDLRVKTAVILKEEITIYGKCFRLGTIFNILGWREINEKPFLVLSKGSWEGLVDYEKFLPILEKLNDK